jgi:hypothetical protein
VQVPIAAGFDPFKGIKGVLVPGYRFGDFGCSRFNIAPMWCDDGYASRTLSQANAKVFLKPFAS